MGSEARKRVYEFLELPHHVQEQRAKAAGVFQDGDDKDIYAEWIKRAKEKGTLDTLMPRREQPQGEASRRRFGMFIHDSTCAVFALDNKVQHTCDCGHAVPAQTEGGEKPKSPCCHLTMRDDTAFYTCSCGRHWIPVELSLPTKWRQIESASPPAQPAGGAREFVIEWAKQYKETYLQVDDIAACAEAYAAQQVRQADAWKKVAEERKKLADSLLDEVAQLRQERDALNTIADKRMKDLERAENCFDEEAKARERSERALREATRDGKWIYCTVKRHDALAELAEALAHVKSSEGAK